MSLHLTIPKPCHEDWQQMLPEEKGRHCLACQKTVIDFTAMTDAELVSFFEQKPTGVCGRFRQEQLTPKPLLNASGIPRWKMYLLALSATLAMKSMLPDRAKAQVPVEQCEPKADLLTVGKIAVVPQTETFTLIGKVTDVANKSLLSGVSVVIKGSTHGTTTGANGEFRLPEVKKGDVVLVSFIGYVTEEKIVRSDQPLTIAMSSDVHFMGEIVIIPLHKRIFSRLKSWLQ